MSPTIGVKPVKGFASFAYPRRARIPIPIPVADRSVISLLDPLIPNPKPFPPNDARAKFVVDVVFVEPSQIRGSDWDPMVLFLKEGGDRQQFTDCPVQEARGAV